MKANELRVGNYFFDRGKTILRLDFWDYGMKPAMRNIVNHGGKDIVLHPFTEDLEECQPIPLTEEWLVKFGFQNDDDDWLIDIDDRNCIHINLKKKRTLLESYDGLLTVKNIEYVHFLQNLYFALTGEELTLKENS